MSASSTATQIQTAFQPILQQSLAKVQQYNQITNDAVAESNRKNIQRTVDAPLVDQAGEIGLVKPPGIDISA
jgi:hypothetical protein